MRLNPGFPGNNHRFCGCSRIRPREQPQKVRPIPEKSAKPICIFTATVAPLARCGKPKLRISSWQPQANWGDIQATGPRFGPVGGWSGLVRTISAGLANARRCCPWMSGGSYASSPPTGGRQTHGLPSCSIQPTLTLQAVDLKPHLRGRSLPDKNPRDFPNHQFPPPPGSPSDRVSLAPTARTEQRRVERSDEGRQGGGDGESR